MNVAEKEHKKYNKVNNVSRKEVKEKVQEESLPDWFDKEIEKKEGNIVDKSMIDDLLKEYQ